MSQIQFTLIGLGEDQTVSVFADGREPGQASSSHPNFQTIVKACLASMGGEDVDVNDLLDLFDVGATIERKFARLSERVSVRGGKIYFDGDEVATALSTQIIRFLDEGEDVDPLVNFYEKIEANPSDNSKRQAFEWLNNHNFTITETGDVIGYKGVYPDGKGGYRSGHQGHACVNGEEINGYIPNAVGDEVTMPRSEVQDDPSRHCHSGLHVGTFSYAQSYAQGCMMAVIVNPRDIVSVPNDAGGQKIRVCRYVIHEIIDTKDGEYTTAIKRIESDLGAVDTDMDVSIPGEDAPRLAVGMRVVDLDGDEGTVVSHPDSDTGLGVKYDDTDYGIEWVGAADLGDEEDDFWFSPLDSTPAVRDAKGRWVAGRPGSQRDPKTGRFAG
jgi:hypothetical protein